MCGNMCGTIQICKVKSVQNATRENQLISSIKISDNGLVDDQSVNSVSPEHQHGYLKVYDTDLNTILHGMQKLLATLHQNKYQRSNTSVASVRNRLEVVAYCTGSTTKVTTLLTMWYSLIRVATQSLEVIRQLRTLVRVSALPHSLHARKDCGKRLFVV